MVNSRTGGAYAPRHLDWKASEGTPRIKGAAVEQSVKHIVPGKKTHNSTILPVPAAPRPLDINTSAAIDDSVSAFDKRVPHQFKPFNTFVLRVIATMVPLISLLGRITNGAGQ